MVEGVIARYRPAIVSGDDRADDQPDPLIEIAAHGLLNPTVGQLAIGVSEEDDARLDLSTADPEGALFRVLALGRRFVDPENAHPSRISFGKSREELRGTVARTIVDEDYGEIGTALPLERIEEAGQIPLLVASGDDDRDRSLCSGRRPFRSVGRLARPRPRPRKSDTGDPEIEG